MSGGLLTTLRYTTLGLGVLSAFSPWLNKYFKLQPGLLRPALNVSWGYLFGSHVWELLNHNLKDSLDDEPVLEEKQEKTFTESDKFYLLALLGNSFVMLTTFGLAPSFKKLQLCAYVSLFSTLVNYFMVVPYVSDKKSECFFFKVVKPKTLTRFLLLTSFVSLAFYTSN